MQALGIMLLLQIIIIVLTIAYLSDCQLKCGKKGKKSNAKIYRGRSATKNMFPWYIDLVVGFPDIKDPKNTKEFLKFDAGGALISNNHVLTVAHLFYPNFEEKFSAKYLSKLDGTAYAHNWKTEDKTQMIKFTGADVTLYPENAKPAFDQAVLQLDEKEYDYDKDNFFVYDIALIRIDSQFKAVHAGISVCPICLMQKDLPSRTQDITIVGMGLTEENKERPSKLQYAKVRQLTAKQCFQKNYPKKEIPENLSNIENRGFCVRGENNEMTCKGDSGSPAVWKNKNGVEYLIGINFFAGKTRCGRNWMKSQKVLPKKSVKPSRYVTIPGIIFKWIEENGGEEMENMIKSC